MPAISIGRVRIGETPRLVAAITGPQVPGQPAAARRAGADLAEFRLDYLAHLPDDRLVETARKAARRSPLPVIATLRPSREGGSSHEGAAADEKRREAVLCAIVPHVHAVDIELSSLALPAVVTAARKAGITIIVSYHHFQSTPSLGRLVALAQLAKAKGADVVKVVTMARTPVEVLRLLSLLSERPGWPIAAFAMGPHALLSRVMGSFCRSALLYGALPGAGRVSAAPGIPTITDLKAAFRQFRLG